MNANSEIIDNRPVDLVVPLGPKTAWGEYEELRYALRSAVCYVSNLRNVYVVGEKPSWLKKTAHLGFPDLHRRNKDANLIHKVLRACMLPELSQKFIRMSDDQLFLADFSFSGHYYLKQLGPESFNRSPAKWYRRLRNTWKAIQQVFGKRYKSAERWNIYNFDAHIPMVYDKRVFREVVNMYPFVDPPGMCINTLYANHDPSPREKLPDGVRLGVAGPVSMHNLQQRCKKALFCNYVDRGLTDVFKLFIQEKFPEPCRFER